MNKERKINLSYVPKKFINQELVNKYFDKYETIDGIPNEYITEEMIEKIIDKDQLNSYFIIHTKNIKSDMSEEFSNKIWNKYKNLSYIPEKYITQEMVDEYWNEYKDLKFIPYEYITQEMVDEYWNEYHAILFIP